MDNQTTTTATAINQLNQSCNCCPYGFHIDTDFVRYCNALLLELYGKSNNNNNNNNCDDYNDLNQFISSSLSPEKTTSTTTTTTAENFLNQQSPTDLIEDQQINDDNDNEQQIINDDETAVLTKTNFEEKNDPIINETDLSTTTNINEEQNNDELSNIAKLSTISENNETNVSDAIVAIDDAIEQLNNNDDENLNEQIKKTESSITEITTTTTTTLSKSILKKIRNDLAKSVLRVIKLEEENEQIPILKKRLSELELENLFLIEKLKKDKQQIINNNNNNNDNNDDEKDKIQKNRYCMKLPEAETIDQIKINDGEKNSKLIAKNLSLIKYDRFDIEPIDKRHIGTLTNFAPCKLYRNVFVQTDLKHKNICLIIDHDDNDKDKDKDRKDSSTMTNNEEKFNYNNDNNNDKETQTDDFINLINKNDDDDDEKIILKSNDNNLSSAADYDDDGDESLSIEIVRHSNQKEKTSRLSPLLKIKNDDDHHNNHDFNSHVMINDLNDLDDDDDDDISRNQFIVTRRRLCDKCKINENDSNNNNNNDNDNLVCSITSTSTSTSSSPPLSSPTSLTNTSTTSSSTTNKSDNKNNNKINRMLKSDSGISVDPKMNDKCNINNNSNNENDKIIVDIDVDNDNIDDDDNDDSIMLRMISSSTEFESIPLSDDSGGESSFSTTTTTSSNHHSTGKENDDEKYRHRKITNRQQLSSNHNHHNHHQTLNQKKLFVITAELKAALKIINENLISTPKCSLLFSKSMAIVGKNWFRISSSVDSNYQAVESYLDFIEKYYTKNLLEWLVNLADPNGNTALHYAISYNNFDIVSILLDSKVCDVDQFNKNGYTATMLVSLAKVDNDIQKDIVERLFTMADINRKAKQNGQTALMLAASHGRIEITKILLECGAEINLQDNDGSTALMCAAEHGHSEVIALLLSNTDCDPLIIDNEGSTALKIALLNGHNDIGVMLYAGSCSHQKRLNNQNHLSISHKNLVSLIKSPPNNNQHSYHQQSSFQN